MSKRLPFTLVLALAAAANSLASDDPVTFWNTVAGNALTPAQGTNPVCQSRTFAMLHSASHDAINAIEARTAHTRRACHKIQEPRRQLLWPPRRVPC